MPFLTRAWLILLMSGLIGSGQAGPKPTWLEPKMHLLHGFEGNLAIAYFNRTSTNGKPLEFSNLTITSLGGKPVRLKPWRTFRAFRQDLLEITFDLNPGDDFEFDTLNLILKGGSKRAVYVGPNRVLYLKPKPQYEISFERSEQVVSDRLYLGMQIFNDSSQAITIERIEYAPSRASAQQILIEPRYDPSWFDQIEAWAQHERGLPKRTKLANPNRLGLVLQPSRGFSAAITSTSIKAQYSCKTDFKRLDTAFLQALIVYRIGNGAQQTYPIPDDILAGVCFAGQ
jgi:hypothetical protein